MAKRKRAKTGPPTAVILNRRDWAQLCQLLQNVQVSLDNAAYAIEQCQEALEARKKRSAAAAKANQTRSSDQYVAPRAAVVGPEVTDLETVNRALASDEERGIA